uniref:Uncharacterized protein n=1 Tax=Salix viminalis TaxID=40686 RepID=A0A6N2KUB1_SALVM
MIGFHSKLVISFHVSIRGKSVQGFINSHSSHFGITIEIYTEFFSWISFCSPFLGCISETVILYLHKPFSVIAHRRRLQALPDTTTRSISRRPLLWVLGLEPR